MENRVIGRFAPTPSGRMHLGNVLCALLAWLSARSSGGKIVLRLEDLDTHRCPPGAAGQLEDDLLWLGLPWDEGGSLGGPHGPYFQSQCTSYYEEALHTLQRQGLLYPCFCTRAELHAADAPHLSDGRVLYSGKCRHLSAEEIAEKANVHPPAIRLRVPDGRIAFLDRCQGLYTQDLAREFGDFLVRRSDGVFAYQLAVVVDDARMGVTEVVRGRDLLSSTPAQLYLMRMLHLRAPRYAHIPLLLAPDGRRLSKRDGDLSLEALRARFRSPEPILGLLAYLCGLQEKPKPKSAQALLEGFSWEKVRREDIRADFPRLLKKL